MENVKIKKTLYFKICSFRLILPAQVTYVTLEHKTSHKGLFYKIEIYASSESWINNISIDVWFEQCL